MDIVGHIVLYGEVVLSSKVKMYWYNREGMSKCILDSELFFYCVLY